MIDYLEENFEELVRAAGTIYIILGIILLGFKVPSNQEYAPYRLSKKLMAVSWWLISCNIFLWIFLFSGNWDKSDPMIECIDIIFYYLTGILLSYSFSNLLDHHYITKRRCITDFGKCALTAVIGGLAMTHALAEYQQWMLTIAFCLLIEFFVSYLLYFRKMYSKSGELFDNYFSNDKRHFIKWIKHSIIFIFLLGVFAAVTINTGAVINWLFQFYIINLNIYITVSFINYAAAYGDLQKADIGTQQKAVEELENKMQDEVEQETEDGRLSSQLKRNNDNYNASLKPKLMAWKEEKRYLKEQFTIDELAAVLGTNKFYLSHFIHDEYNMNFSTWISSMRLQEAKRMMTERSDLKIEEIAYAVGFSSLSYFSKVFSKLEGTSPSAWMKENML